MDNIGVIETIKLSLLGFDFEIAPKLFLMTYIVIAILVVLGFLGGRKAMLIPHGLQNFWEMIIGFFEELVLSTFGESGRKFIPFFTTLFLFICLSNLLGMLPFLEEPTKYLSTDLAMGLMVFFMVHFLAIKTKGIKKYFKSYCEPIFILLPLNIIGEVAKVVSHSFRLFGNILGGSIIIIILSYLLSFAYLHFLLPPFLQLFFGLFAGVIQAFVFTMLAVTYLSIAIND